jgi:ribosomal protein L11 methyltransferase
MNDPVTTNWLKISLNCPEIVLEAASDLIGVLSGSGVEQTPVKDGQSVVSGFFRLDIEDNEDERKGILQRLEREMAELFSIYELTPPKPECSVMADEDWATSWRQFFTPFAIIPGLVIKPSWEEYTAGPDEQMIEMDPGMAFGTGQHASTKLALSLMQTCFQNNPPKNVLDIGTGTGILSMAAGLFGADRVIAVDNDPEAVRVARENIAHNNLQRSITASGDDLSEITGGFNLICANIIHDVLVDMAPAIARLLADNGSVVLAGILRGEQEDNIIKVYGELNFTLQASRHEDEWVSLLLTA